MRRLTRTTLLLVLLLCAISPLIYLVGILGNRISAAAEEALATEEEHLRRIDVKDIFDTETKRVNRTELEGQRLKVAATSVCRWQDRRDDSLETENPAHWTEDRVPDQYVVAATPIDHDCDGIPLPSWTYVLLKVALRPSESDKNIKIVFKSPSKEVTLSVRMTRKGPLNPRETWKWNQSGIEGDPGEPRYFLVPPRKPDSAATTKTALIRLQAPHVTDDLQEDWSIVATETFGPTTNAIPIVVGSKPVPMLRDRDVLKRRFAAQLGHCVSLYGVGSFAAKIPTVDGECNEEKLLRGVLDQFAKSLLGLNRLNVSRHVQLGDLPLELSTRGEPQIVAKISQVWAVCLLYFAALGVFILTRAVLSYGIRTRIRGLVQLIEKSQDGRAEGDFSRYFKDPELRELARAAKVSVEATHAQAALLAETVRLKDAVARDKTVEEHRATAFEECIYCLRHELRNFVKAVLIVSNDPKLKQRATLAERLIGSIEDLSTGSFAESDLSDASFENVTIGQLLDGWLAQRGAGERAALTVSTELGDAASESVHCVPSLVYQVLDKYLENALEHRVPVDAHVEVGLIAEANFCGIFLWNSSPEFDAERAERLFRPLSLQQRSDGAQPRGFGLFAVRQYAIATRGYAAAVALNGGVKVMIMLQKSSEILSKDSVESSPISAPN